MRYSVISAPSARADPLSASTYATNGVRWIRQAAGKSLHRTLRRSAPRGRHVSLGETETRVQFEAEPTAFRWRFHRGRDEVWIQLLQLPDGHRRDKAGTEIWSSWQTVDSVARAVIRCFDDVAHEYGESGYQDKWGSPFPRLELERLRTVWKARRFEKGS